jgi:hypothetical protein
LLSLGRFIYNNRSFVLSISSGERVDTAYNVYNFGPLQNFNTTPGLTGFIGGKVGKTTAAQETALVFYEVPVEGTTRTLAFIVLGTPDRYQTVTQLHQYIISQYSD